MDDVFNLNSMKYFVSLHSTINDSEQEQCISLNYLLELISYKLLLMILIILI